MKFHYSAFDNRGQATSGDLEANTTIEAADQLRAKGLFIDTITEASTTGTRRGTLGYGKRMRYLAMFSRQLQVLVSSGTPLVQALSAVERQADDPNWQYVVKSLRETVESGTPLSTAMKKHPGMFDAICLSLVSAGEASGDMPGMLDRLADITRKQLKLRNMIVGATVYPCLLIVLGVAVMLTLLLFVLPRFSDLFTQLDSPLPPSTQVLMWLSGMLIGYWWMIVPAVLLLVGVGYWWVANGGGKTTRDEMLLKLPRIGKLVRSLMTARLARMLGTLLESRVTLLDALQLSRESVTHSGYRDLILRAEQAVSKGEPVSAILSNSELISAPVQEALRTGEQSGQLGRPLVQMADFLDEENDVVVKAITSLIEPAILIILGIMVGTVAISMFLPLFDLVSAAQKGGH